MASHLGARTPTQRAEKTPPKKAPFPNRGLIRSPDAFRSQRMPLHDPTSQADGPSSQSERLDAQVPGVRRVEIWAKLRFPSKVTARSPSDHRDSQYAFMRNLITRVGGDRPPHTCQIQQTEQPITNRFGPTDKWCIPHCEFAVDHNPHYEAIPRTSSGKSESRTQVPLSSQVILDEAVTRRGFANITTGRFTFITPTLQGLHNFGDWQRDVGTTFAHINKYYNLQPCQYSIPLTKRRQTTPGYGFTLAEYKLVAQGFAHFSAVIEIVFPCLGEKMFAAGDPAAAMLPHRIERMGNMRGLLKVIEATFHCLSIDPELRGIVFLPNIRASTSPPLTSHRVALDLVENLVHFVEAILRCESWARLGGITANMSGFKYLMTGKHEPKGSALALLKETTPRQCPQLPAQITDAKRYEHRPAKKR